MAHLSPAVYLVWSLLTSLLTCFIVFHLWSFDRFKCLRWNQGPYAGSFKRIMTYSLLLTMPCITIAATGFAIIKYNYGFTVVPGLGILPTPYQEWGHWAQGAIFPFYLFLSTGWSLEIVTHLEELCFWLFLVNSGSAQQDWFKSLYFRVWAVGSCVAVLTMPLITIFTRKSVLQCEAYTYLTGGLAGLSVTIWSLPVLWTFPSFIENLKEYDVDADTSIRLTKYHELNCIRVVFRFLFTVPFVILGIDGVRPHHHVNESLFATDLLGIFGAIGCVVSSGITLVIFFPRSIQGEIAYREKQRSRRRQRAQHAPGSSLPRWGRTRTPTVQTQHMASASQTFVDAESSYMSITQQSKMELDHYEATNGSVSTRLNIGVGVGVGVGAPGMLPAYEAVTVRPSIKVAMLDKAGYEGGSFSLQPNRRTTAGSVALGAVLTDNEVELARARSRRERGVSSLVYQWRSPIDLARPTVSRWQQRV